MSEGRQELTPEQRRQIEEEEELREAEWAAERSRQRALLQQVEVDRYVEGRVKREMDALLASRRAEEEAERAAAGEHPGPAASALLLVGAGVSAALLALIHLLRSG